MWRVRNLFYETGIRIQLDTLRNTARNRHLLAEGCSFFTPREQHARVYSLFSIASKIVGDIGFDALQQTSRKYTQHIYTHTHTHTHRSYIYVL